MKNHAELRWRALIGFATAIPVAFLGLFFAWPAVTLITYGLGGETGIDLGAAAQILLSARTLRVIEMTLTMAVAGTTISVIIGVGLAHLLYRLRFRGRALARAVVSIPFVLPTVAVSAGFRTLFRDTGTLGFLGLNDSMTAVVIAMVFFNVSLAARSVGSTWAHLDPAPEEAARMLGANQFQVWWDITRPRLRPVIAGVAAIVFLYCSTAYSIVLILGGRHVATLETEIYRETTQLFNLRAAAVLSLLQLVIVVAALVLANRIRRHSTTGSEVAYPVDRPLRRSDLPWVIPLAVVVVILTVAPLTEIVIRSCQRRGEWTLANYRDFTNPAATAALPVSVWESLRLSLTTAVEAATCALIVGLAIAIVVTRQPKSVFLARAQQAFDSLTMLPLGISAVTVGFGFLLTLSGPPLHLAQSNLMVPAAQASVAVPLVVRLMVPSLRAVAQQWRDAASLLGATKTQVLYDIDIRASARAGVIAWGYAFAISMGEFGATSFLIRPLTPTLPVVIYRLAARPGAVEQGMAMAGAVILSLVTAIVMVAVEYGRRHERSNHG